jgi:hypothetical protein
MRKKIALTAVAVLATVSAFAFTGAKVAHASNTCSSSSPLLADNAAEFTLNGAAPPFGGLYQVAMWGTWSTNASLDCIYARVNYTGEGPGIYAPADVFAELWYSPSYGVWEPYSGVGTKYTGHAEIPDDNLETEGIIVNGATSFGGDCIVVNPTVQATPRIGPYFEDVNSHLYNEASGNIPYSNTTPLICPTS